MRRVPFHGRQSAPGSKQPLLPRHDLPHPPTKLDRGTEVESSTTQAINATETPATSAEPADRSVAFGLVLGGVALGLPIPERINLYEFRAFMLHFEAAHTESVDRWAAYLSLRQPDRKGTVHALDTDTPWKMYEARGRCELLPGWSMTVNCTVPATDAEIDAARALVDADATCVAVTE